MKYKRVGDIISARTELAVSFHTQRLVFLAARHELCAH